MEGVITMLADDVTWTTRGPPDVIPYAGERKGHDQVTGYFEAFGASTETTAFEPRCSSPTTMSSCWDTNLPHRKDGQGRRQRLRPHVRLAGGKISIRGLRRQRRRGRGVHGRAEPGLEPGRRSGYRAQERIFLV